MSDTDMVKQNSRNNPIVEPVPISISLVVPVVIGCAIIGVAVIIGYTFARKQEESLARKQSAKARGALRESLDAIKKRDYIAAESAASRAIKLAEEIKYSDGLSDAELQSTGYLFRAEARSGIGGKIRLEAAIDDYSQCLKLNPAKENRFMAYYGRGQVLYRVGNFKLAEKCFTDALSINKYSAVVYGARALTRSKLGKVEKARQDQKRAMELGAMPISSM